MYIEAGNGQVPALASATFMLTVGTFLPNRRVSRQQTHASLLSLQANSAWFHKLCQYRYLSYYSPFNIHHNRIIDTSQKEDTDNQIIHFLSHGSTTLVGPGLLTVEDSRSHSDAPHLQQTHIHAFGGIRTRSPSRRKATDPRFRPRGYWDRQYKYNNT